MARSKKAKPAGPHAIEDPYAFAVAIAERVTALPTNTTSSGVTSEEVEAIVLGELGVEPIDEDTLYDAAVDDPTRAPETPDELHDSTQEPTP